MTGAQHEGAETAQAEELWSQLSRLGENDDSSCW